MIPFPVIIDFSNSFYLWIANLAICPSIKINNKCFPFTGVRYESKQAYYLYSNTSIYVPLTHGVKKPFFLCVHLKSNRTKKSKKTLYNHLYLLMPLSCQLTDIPTTDKQGTNVSVVWFTFVCQVYYGMLHTVGYIIHKILYIYKQIFFLSSLLFYMSVLCYNL